RVRGHVEGPGDGVAQHVAPRGGQGDGRSLDPPPSGPRRRKGGRRPVATRPGRRAGRGAQRTGGAPAARGVLRARPRAAAAPHRARGLGLASLRRLQGYSPEVRSSLRVLTALAIACAIAGVAAAPAMACSCAALSKPQLGREADLVFTGRAQSVAVSRAKLVATFV